VPAGIANTASGLLQRRKKTSVFGWSNVFARAATPHVAFRRARAAHTARSSAQSRNTAQKHFSTHRMHRENKGFRRVAIFLRLPRATLMHAAHAMEKAAATKR
jgi:hypothetical protein